MICIGIEGTAHTLGIGAIKDDMVLADIRKLYSPAPGSGIIPRDAAQFIGRNMKEAVDEALNHAGITFEDVDLISFSQGPGLGPCLRTVATAARVLSLHHKIPIIGVNHSIAHIEIVDLTAGNCKDIVNPLVAYVSGGNTQILQKKEGRYRIFGETLDIGLGNAIDKFGRAVGISQPAGPEVERYALKGKKYLPLPYVIKGTDLSFSGILTAAIQKFKRGADINDLCFSFQETVFAMLTETTERALAHTKSKSLVLVGGVGNNKRLQEMMGLMAGEQGATFISPQKYCSDNGVMIAHLGLKMYKAGLRMNIKDTVIKQRFRTDEVEIKW